MAGNANQLPVMLFWGGEIVRHGDHKSVDYSDLPKTVCFLSRSSRHDELVAAVHSAMNTNEGNTKLTLFGRYPSKIPGGQVLFVPFPLANNQSWQWFLEATLLFQPVHVYIVAEKITDDRCAREYDMFAMGEPLLKNFTNRVSTSGGANDRPSDGENEGRVNVEDDGRVRKIRRFCHGEPLHMQSTSKAGSSYREYEGAINGGNAAAFATDVTASGVPAPVVAAVSILSSLTLRNYKRVLEQMKDVNIDNARCLAAFTKEIYNQAVMQPAFCEMLVGICSPLDHVLPKFSVDNKELKFMRCLSDCCHTELERGKGDGAFGLDYGWMLKRKKSKLGNIPPLHYKS